MPDERRSEQVMPIAGEAAAEKLLRLAAIVRTTGVEQMVTHLLVGHHGCVGTGQKAHATRSLPASVPTAWRGPKTRPHNRPRLHRRDDRSQAAGRQSTLFDDYVVGQRDERQLGEARGGGSRTGDHGHAEKSYRGFDPGQPAASVAAA